MQKINWSGANYKDWVGVSAAPVFWVASLVCFVLGLSFKQGTGIIIPGTTLDLAILFSVGLGLANTAIQIVGNDTEKDDLGMALFLMWGASYMLGIGSNVNFLYTIIGLNNIFLQFLVCWGLGIMIEVAPERLLVRWLRGVGILKTSGASTNKPVQQFQKANVNGSSQTAPYIVPTSNIRQEAPEPTYHPVGYQSDPKPQAKSNFPQQLKNQYPTQHRVNNQYKGERRDD